MPPFGKKRSSNIDDKALEERRHKRALRLFTNRDDERDILRQFFEAIHADGQELKKPILSFYGVGGVGKSSLLRQAWEEFHQNHPGSDLYLIHLDLDSQITETTLTPVSLLWKMRCQIYEQAQVPFYLFDLLYMKYMEKGNQSVELKAGPILNLLNSVSVGSDAISPVLEGLGNVLNSSKIAEMGGKVINFVWGKAKQKSIAKKFHVNQASFDELSIKDLESLMPKIFAEELGLSLTDMRDSWAHRKVSMEGVRDFKPTLCLALDGYERVSKDVERILVEVFLTRLVTSDEYYAHFGYLILGREQLDWGAYDTVLKETYEDSDEATWANAIDSHRLGGLTESYADQFLRAASGFYREEGNSRAANLVEKYLPNIKTTCNDKGVYHPFYLDLCLEAIERHGDAFDPDKHLGKTPPDLIKRFLKYLDDSSRKWHRAFAIAGEFGEEVCSYLLDVKSISGDLQDYAMFVHGHSYITPQQGTDTYKFHRLMQESLIADMANASEVVRESLKSSVVDKLVGFYDEKLLGRNMESMTDADVEALELANEMLIGAVRSKLLLLPDAYAQWVEWQKAFDGAFFSTTVPIARQWLGLHRELLDEKHLDVATGLNNLADLLDKQGNYEEAEALCREALAMRRELLDEKHLDVATGLNNLACVLNGQGKYEEAEALHRESLAMRRELLGEQHHLGVASSLNNLADVLNSQGKYEEAETLHREALAIRRELLDEKDLDVATSLNNLACVLDDLGKYEEAEALHREALAIRRELLGEKHPHVEISLNNLADTLNSQHKYEEAETLHREALAMSRELLGEKHPHVTISLNNLADVLNSQGKYEEAETLYREVLAMRRELVGDKHLDVAASLNTLADMLNSQNKYEEAETQYCELLAMLREQLGEKHQAVVMTLNNLVNVLKNQNKHDEAEKQYRESLAILRKLPANEKPLVLEAASLNNLAGVLVDLGKYEEAETLHRESLAILKALPDSRKNPVVAMCLNNLVGVLNKQGKHEEAEALCREAP